MKVYSKVYGKGKMMNVRIDDYNYVVDIRKTDETLRSAFHRICEEHYELSTKKKSMRRNVSTNADCS